MIPVADLLSHTVQMSHIEVSDDQVDRAIKRHGRLTALVILGWAAILSMTLAYVVAWTYFGDLSCEAFPDTSSYGEVVWSVVPPGPICTFTEANNGFDEVRGPSPVMSILIFLLIAGGVLVAMLLRSPADRDGSIRT